MRGHALAFLLLGLVIAAPHCSAATSQEQLTDDPTGPAHGKIPRQLILTGKQDSLEELPEAVKGNVRRMLALNSGLGVRWLGDSACRTYIGQHFPGLAQFFGRERRGSYRGDMCRAAVLAREGGFYIDNDLQLRVPLIDLVDSATTFMSAFTEDGALLNALIAAEPESAIMAEVVREIESWYGGNRLHPIQDGTTQEWMGPITLLRGVRGVLRLHCPSEDVRAHHAGRQWACGSHRLRFYQEQRLRCGLQDMEECPSERRSSGFEGLQFGIFALEPDRKLVAWPRFEGCREFGCHGGGWDTS